MRIAFATSTPSVSAAVAIQEAFATGAAISAWRSSWKPPRPSWVVSVWPDSSTSGDSWPSAVISAGGGVGVAGAAGDHGDAGLAGQPAPKASAACTAAASWRVCTRSMAGADRGVEQRHDVVAGQGEDRRVSGAFQRAHDDVGAAQGWGHGVVSLGGLGLPGVVCWGSVLGWGGWLKCWGVGRELGGQVRADHDSRPWLVCWESPCGTAPRRMACEAGVSAQLSWPIEDAPALARDVTVAYGFGSRSEFVARLGRKKSNADEGSDAHGCI